MLGKFISYFSSKNEYEIYFFFPFYHTGGAEKVHAQITQALKNKKAIIYFTRKSQNNTHYYLFKNSSHCIKDISFYTDNKFFYFLNIIYRGYLAYKINKQISSPIILNGQSNFGYKVAPWVKSSIQQIELIHSFNSFSYIRIPFIQFYAKTIMISKKKIEEHLIFYKKINVPDQYYQNITHINNAIKIKEQSFSKDLNSSLTVLYVGRNSPEKRIHIIIQIAKRCYESNLLVKFQFLGINKGEITATPNCEFLGNQTDENLIESIYQKAHCLIITSSTEGFPMVVIEAMAHHCVIIATAVGDIPVHIKRENGYIIDNYMNEATVINEAYKAIDDLEKNPMLLKQIGVKNYQYAKEHFSLDTFNFAYQKIFKN